VFRVVKEMSGFGGQSSTVYFEHLVEVSGSNSKQRSSPNHVHGDGPEFEALIEGVIFSRFQLRKALAEDGSGSEHR